MSRFSREQCVGYEEINKNVMWHSLCSYSTCPCCIDWGGRRRSEHLNEADIHSPYITSPWIRSPYLLCEKGARKAVRNRERLGDFDSTPPRSWLTAAVWREIYLAGTLWARTYSLKCLKSCGLCTSTGLHLFLTHYTESAYRGPLLPYWQNSAERHTYLVRGEHVHTWTHT